MDRQPIALAILLLFSALASPAWPTAMTFDGVDDKVAVTSFAGIESTTLTVGCWTYRTGDGPGTGGRIMSAEDATWYLRDAPGTTTYNFLRNWSTDFGEWTISRPSQDAWHHVAVTYDGGSDANDPLIYVDGASVSVTETNTAIGTLSTGTPAMNIGNRTGSDRGWVGHLASCFYYDRVLSLGEIRQLMSRGPQTLRRNLQCYWPLGVFSGRSVSGAGAASCLGTVSGTPASTGSGPPVSVPQGGLP